VLDRDEVFEILEEWNRWDAEETGLVTRPGYESRIRRLQGAREVIIVKGIRRCGKSSLLRLHVRNLAREIGRRRTLFVNLEDSRFIEELDVSLLDRILDTYMEYIDPKGDVHVFLDEVQNIPAWETWVRTKYETQPHIHIYVTGSSSRLLSREFATVVTGRYLDVTVYPLDFEEFLRFKNVKATSRADMVAGKSSLRRLFDEYMEFGGFPKVAMVDELVKKEELNAYFQSILFKDVVTRHHLKHADHLQKLAHYMLANTGKTFSVNGARKMLKISYEAARNYVEYLKEAFLILELPRFSYSLKSQIGDIKKYYCIDTGMAYAVSFRFSRDVGRILENVVFLELKRVHGEVYYHKERHECDFLVKQELGITHAIQVTKRLSEQNRKRELNGLVEAALAHNLTEGLVLTYDQQEIIEHEGVRITVKPVWKWILETRMGEGDSRPTRRPVADIE